LVLAVLALVVPRIRPLPLRLRSWAAWLTAFPIVLTVWEIVTAKTALLPLPFFAPPQSILEALIDDKMRLADSALHSLGLLLPGYLMGAFVGFVLGLGIGWSPAISYWGHPVLRFLGPLPATAWLPIAFFVFPSSWTASAFLIALTAAFPVAVLTSSGVKNVNRDFYDIALTMGASRSFLIFRVAVPAAMPQVFVGLFMGLGGSFAVLIIAEMLGVKSGFGFYLSWAQGWAAYANFYAALIFMSLLFSGLISLLFALRNRLLAWQRGLVRW
jgi:NitT/TauT family transport system permease protein